MCHICHLLHLCFSLSRRKPTINFEKAYHSSRRLGLGTEERVEACFIALQSASNFLGSHLFLEGVTYTPQEGDGDDER